MNTLSTGESDLGRGECSDLEQIIAVALRGWKFELRHLIKSIDHKEMLLDRLTNIHCHDERPQVVVGCAASRGFPIT